MFAAYELDNNMRKTIQMENYVQYSALGMALINLTWHIIRHIQTSSCVITRTELELTDKILDIVDKIVEDKINKMATE